MTRIMLAINGRFLAQPTTGVQRVARELSREIDALVASGEFDFDVEMICQPQARLEDLDFRAIRVRRLSGGRGQAWEQFALPTAVGSSTLLCLGNTAPAWSLMRRQPVAVMVHDLSYRYYPEAYRYGYRVGHRLLTPLLLRRADPVFTVSEAERGKLIAHDPSLAGRIILAPNGGWRDTTAAIATPTDTPRPYVLYVGALSQRKNFDRLLEAAIRLAREDGTATTFIGAGGNVLSPARVDVPSDVAHLLSFVGQIEDPVRLADAYRQASCLLFPSLYEASPLPPLEAMHFGCPVVASDIPALRERCGDAAEYCDPEDVGSIVRATRRVLNDPARANTLRDRGHGQSRRFTWRAQARIVLSALARTNGERMVEIGSGLE